MTDWATSEQTKNRTGVEVTDDELGVAQVIVEIFANTTTDASDAGLIASRNLRLLSYAVSFQAVWMREHPDVFTNIDVTNFSQDGTSATPAHANAHLLAPLAKRCIDRLSWNLEPLRAHRPFRTDDRGNRDSAVRDDHMPWVPL